MRKLMTLFAGMAGLLWSMPILAVTTYPLFCRGPLPASAFTSAVTITFKRNAIYAGTSGSYLTPGTCAWADRPVAATEPAAFIITTHVRQNVNDPLGYKTGEIVYTFNNYPTFIACNNNSKCTFRVNVYNDAGKRFVSPGPELYTYYPFP